MDVAECRHTDIVQRKIESREAPIYALLPIETKILSFPLFIPIYVRR